LGLVPFSLFQLMLRAFYAMQDTRTPFLINCAAVALNIVLNIAFFAAIGVQGLAAGHAAAYSFGLFLQLRALRKRVGQLGGRRILRSVARIGAAGAGMGVAVAALIEVTDRVVEDPGAGMQLTIITVAVVLGAAVYLLLAKLLRVEELQLARGIVTRRTAGPS
jgi:putative peptidoglycan lipid II flippase